MPADYYSDAQAEPAAPAAEEAAPAEETEPTPEKETTEPVAELPKNILGGKTFKPGEEVVLEIVEVRENSVLVKYASEKGGEGEGEGYGGGEGEEETPPKPGSMASMMY